MFDCQQLVCVVWRRNR